MPSTAKKHFDQDIVRAKAILHKSHGMPSGRAKTKLLRDDLMRSAMMFSVGAADAYFCDAYTDLVARMLRAKTAQDDISISSAIKNIALPVSALFYKINQRNNWKWRMAARELMEKDNVLSLSKVQTLFNPFFRVGHKLFETSVLDSLVISHNAPNRVTGITRTQYRALTGQALDRARKSVRNRINKRYKGIFQRRNDCIHNCDRPKLKVQGISYTIADKLIKDVTLLVGVVDQHTESEFNELLAQIGCNAITRNSAGY